MCESFLPVAVSVPENKLTTCTDALSRIVLMACILASSSHWVPGSGKETDGGLGLIKREG